MTIPMLTRRAIEQVRETNDWVQRNKRNPPPSPENHAAVHGNCVGVLLQDIWGDQSGPMQLLQAIPDNYSLEVAVAGENPIEGSAFKLQFLGTTPASPTGVVLGTSARIPSLSTAEQMQTILRNSLNYADISVQLGNPYRATSLVVYPRPQPELDLDKLLAYTGVWLISFSGAITQQYQTIFAQVIEDPTAFMKGVSTAVTQPTKTVLSGTTVIVHDIFCRPRDYPWRIGERAVCIPIQGRGLGIIASSYRDMTSIPYAVPQ